MVAELDVKKMDVQKPHIHRIELEYKDMHYIIVNLEEHVIDVDGELWEFSLSNKILEKIEKLTWSYQNLDEYAYWSNKEDDGGLQPMLWRISWIDEFSTYYHKSGSLKYPEQFEDLIQLLKELR